MGACNVDTGYIPSGPVPPQGECVVPAGGRRILICPETPLGTTVSDTFEVAAGQMAVLDAYNLTPGYHIYIQRVVRRAYCSSSGTACDPYDMHATKFPVSGPVVFYDRMTLGSGADWSLYVPTTDDADAKSRKQLIVAVPGVYRLELEDANAMLGNLEVEYTINNMVGLALPPAYFAGID